jgi:flagellar basal body rod protein FlgC
MDLISGISATGSALDAQRTRLDVMVLPVSFQRHGNR